MSSPKVIGPGVTTGAAVASLPVTGSPTIMLVAIGLAIVVAGLLLVRAGRLQRDPV